MKYLILITLISLFFCSCSNQVAFDELEFPIVVVAIQKPYMELHDDRTDIYHDGSIVLRDVNGKIWSCNGGYSTSNALISSCEVGDTLK